MEQLKQKAGVTPSRSTTFEGGGDMLLNVLNHTLDMGVGELQEIRPQLDAGSPPAAGGRRRRSGCRSFRTSRPCGNRASTSPCASSAGWQARRDSPPEVIAAWEAAIPKLLDDPAYRKLYTANSLQPGFMPHDEYVKFMATFGKETEAFLQDAGVIE